MGGHPDSTSDVDHDSSAERRVVLELNDLFVLAMSKTTMPLTELPGSMSSRKRSAVLVEVDASSAVGLVLLASCVVRALVRARVRASLVADVRQRDVRRRRLRVRIRPRSEGIRPRSAATPGRGSGPRRESYGSCKENAKAIIAATTCNSVDPDVARTSSRVCAPRLPSRSAPPRHRA